MRSRVTLAACCGGHVRRLLIPLVAAFVGGAGTLPAQEHAGHRMPAMTDTMPGGMSDPQDHDMWMWALGRGWSLMAMGQGYPVYTVGAPGEEASPLNESAFYLTQPALMANLEGRASSTGGIPTPCSTS